MYFPHWQSVSRQCCESLPLSDCPVQALISKMKPFTATCIVY